ncbi:MAG: hypothetical protein ABSA92_14015 [Candidatus Bathyarchaeia archaeon]
MSPFPYVACAIRILGITGHTINTQNDANATLKLEALIGLMAILAPWAIAAWL